MTLLTNTICLNDIFVFEKKYMFKTANVIGTFRLIISKNIKKITRYKKKEKEEDLVVLTVTVQAQTNCVVTMEM